MSRPLAEEETRVGELMLADNWKPVMPDEGQPLMQDAINGGCPPGYRFAGRWEYRDVDGQLVFHVVRYDQAAPNAGTTAKQVVPFTWCEGPNGKREWRKKAWPEPRLLYSLDTLAASSGKPVLVVEGEKTVHAAQARFTDHVVTTSPGGSNAAGRVNWSPLMRRDVTIWPDNDEAGIKYANEVARLATEAGASSVRIVGVPSSFPPKWDLADEPPEGYDADKLADLLSSAVAALPAIEPPMPLLRDTPLGEPYPLAALGPLKDAVEAVQGMTLAPMAIPAASALAVASVAVQGFRNVETLDGERPLSLYALTIAKSGERKSSCDAKIMAGLRDFEKEQAAAQLLDVAAWQNSHALWKGERERILADAKKDKGVGRGNAEAELSRLGSEPAAPPSPDRTVTEPTFEGLTRKFTEGMPTLGIFSDEGGQFLGGFAMSSDNRQKTMAAMNDLWQGNPIRRTRAGEGSSVLFGRRLAVHLMVQPGVARDFMADPMTADTGFLPRFLICEPPSTIGTRLQANISRNGTALSAFGTRLYNILRTLLPMDSKTRELSPSILPLSQEARVLLAAFSDHVEMQQAPGREYAAITGYASKSAEQAARIAGVLTVWSDLDAAEVTADTMVDAIKLAQFYLSEALRLVDAANVSKEIGNAEALRTWILDEWPHPEVMPRDILQSGPNRLRESPVARAAIALLEKHGWLVKLPANTIVRNAPRKEAYRIVRVTP